MMWGPWTDFYALGVVAYRCVTGVTDRELLEGPRRARLAARGEREKDMRPAVELAEGEYDQRLLKAIDWCMRVDERERPQGVADLEAALKTEPPGPRPPREAKTSNQEHAYALPSGFMLEEYRIERVLGSSWFGITYYAWDTRLKKAVVIKEYLPRVWAMRYDEATVALQSSSDAGDYDWGLARFLEEARVLAGIDHPNINKVYRRLEAHGTAYMVLEYLPGESLSARLKRTDRLSPDEVWRLFNELLSGLAEVHRQAYVHREIKPANIMFREDGGAVLLDFGAARQAVAEYSGSITIILTQYAPLEQYDRKVADVGPWTDFYALGVVAYRCVTGVGERQLLYARMRERLATRGKGEKDMRPAVELAEGEYDRRLLKAIDWCMRVDERERPQGVADLEAALKTEPPGPRPPREAKTSNQEHAYALPSGFMLEEYRIERVLGAGGFGISYYAWDTRLKKAVMIKEYLPSEFGARYESGITVVPKSSLDADDYEWGLKCFLEEARVLAGFDHPHINKVYRQLEAHNTAYMVLEYLPGESLSDRLKRTGRLSPEEVWRLFNELLSGLAEVHRQDYVHRDVKPANIMFREDGRAVLLDFYAARQVVGQRSESITVIVTPGYAPLEQYDEKAAYVGPWTDFYALGITAYRCVTGLQEGELLDAVARARLVSRGEHEKDMRPAVELAEGEYDRRLLEAIDWCMQVDERKRPRRVADLEAALKTEPGPRPEPTPKPNPVPKPSPASESTPPRHPAIWAAAGAVGALLLGFGVWQWLSPSSPFPDKTGEVSAPALISPPATSKGPAGTDSAGNKRPALAEPVKVFRDALKSGGEGPEMVVLPTGSFRMGDLSGDGMKYEKPVRSVTISRSIAMGRYEVRFAEYDRFARATGRALPDDEGWGRGNRPVVNVSQEDAKAYAVWLSAQTGKRYRLPSEAEWEYAARAGTTTKYSWGNSITCSQARYGRSSSGECSNSMDGTVAVGSFAANAFGLYDMHGNVTEWVEDCWHDNYEGAPSDGRAWKTGCDSEGESAVLRSGSWISVPRTQSSASRSWFRPSTRSLTYGFRLVQDLNP